MPFFRLILINFVFHFLNAKKMPTIAYRYTQLMSSSWDWQKVLYVSPSCYRVRLHFSPHLTFVALLHRTYIKIYGEKKKFETSIHIISYVYLYAEDIDDWIEKSTFRTILQHDSRINGVTIHVQNTYSSIRVTYKRSKIYRNFRHILFHLRLLHRNFLVYFSLLTFFYFLFF